MPSLRDFFVTVPITSLKFWANIPTCFPNIFTVSSPLWILRMQRHAGKQGTCRCIPRSCIFQMLVIVNYELHHTKNCLKSDIAMMKPSNSKYRCNHRGFVNSGNSRSLGTTKARCPNHPIARKLCLTKKKQAIFTDFCSVQKSPDFNAPGRAAGHFWPSRPRSRIPFNFIEGKRQGVCFGNKNKVSWPYFPFFVTNTHHFLLSSFPMQLKTCNNHPKKTGCQDHRWRAVI